MNLSSEFLLFGQSTVVLQFGILKYFFGPLPSCICREEFENVVGVPLKGFLVNREQLPLSLVIRDLDFLQLCTDRGIHGTEHLVEAEVLRGPFVWVLLGRNGRRLLLLELLQVRLNF